MHRSSLLIATMLLFTLAACGKQSAPLSGSESRQDGLFQQLPQGMTELSSPQAALDSLRDTSAGPVFILDGADYEDTLAMANISRNSATGIFSPHYDPASPSLADCAYGIFRFTMSGITGAQSLRLVHSSAAVNTADIWLGFANFDHDLWNWFPFVDEDPAPGFKVADLAPYTAGDDTLLVVVLVTGTLELQLQSLSFSLYDEIEQNDAIGQATNIPGFGATGLRGSLGSDISYAGYDGDGDDYWELEGSWGDDAKVQVQFDPLLGDFELELLKTDGTVLYTDTDDFGSGFLYWSGHLEDLFDPDPVDFPLFIHLHPISGYGDYTLDCLTGTSPVKDLQVSPLEGTAPLSVTFDASGSTDSDGSVVRYLYWINSLGGSFSDEIDTAEPVVDYEFTQPGYYSINLTIFDDDGFQQFNFPPSTYVSVHPSAYTEIENNDSNAAPQDLGSIDQGQLNGNVGLAMEGNTSPNDGDELDVFGMLLDPAKSYSFHVAGQGNSFYPCALSLKDSEGSTVGFEEIGGDNRGFVYYNIEPGTENQHFLHVYPFGETDFADYTLSWISSPRIDATIDIDQPAGSVPKTLTFTANVTSTANIVLYRWTFYDTVNDEQEHALPTAQHEYSAEGNYSIDLELVTDTGFSYVVHTDTLVMSN